MTNAEGNDNKIDGFKPRRKTQGLNDTGAVRPKLRKKNKIQLITVLYLVIVGICYILL